MRAEFLVKLPVLAFGEKMQVHLAHDCSVAIRIVERAFRAVPAHRSHTIIAVTLFSGQHCLKKSVVMNSFRRDLLLRGKDDCNFARIRPKDANNQIVSNAMRTENPKRIGMRSFNERSQFVGR